ncbi:NADP-dependent oxidoreductase [Companilactobacillus ginsenosidimutans]|uniref:Oxidoreductase n=1 Tax=Companilactobacillus ginsenosidimutans TaxID=1007676 RepID=A0A0H4QHH5_9LACO|nr:NADP-dependent oxidoreductase [Companilactobacillus ginsenosidimutans]AKP67869.1 oxidoreductase [Companilactobacillus ginsenosidimutans]
MKAYGFNQYGNSSVMSEFELPQPKIGTNDVLVKTSAFAINAFDIAVRNGQFRNNVTMLFPLILGSDAVGRIVKVGSNVDTFKVGDDVLAHPGIGTYAEYFKVGSDRIGLVPRNYDSYEAAGLPLSGITAYNTLVHVAHVGAGQTIAILGSGGGVGAMLVQMAKALGLYVIGTDLSSAKEQVLSLGASEFGAFDTESVREKFANIADVLIDATNNGDGGKAGIDIVKDNGTYVSLTTLPYDQHKKPGVNFKQMIAKREYRDSDAFAAISLMISNNQLHVPIDKLEAFSLKGIRSAQDAVENGNTNGKVIIKL